MNILETKNLKKHFGGVYAINGLSLAFGQGTITALVGPNGSGKSTLTNLISGLYAFDAGEITIQGERLKKIHPENLPDYGITRTFQEVRLFEQMTVEDNLLVVLTERRAWPALFSRHNKQHEQKAKAILEKVGLWDKRHHLANSLSYGQRKLLEIARVLAMDAKIILFDEPFAGLFKEMTNVIVSVMMELKHQGKTLLLIEHNMDLIRQLSDYVYVLDNGELLAEGTAEKVLKERKVVEAYLGQ